MPFLVSKRLVAVPNSQTRDDPSSKQEPFSDEEELCPSLLCSYILCTCVSDVSSQSILQLFSAVKIIPMMPVEPFPVSEVAWRYSSTHGRRFESCDLHFFLPLIINLSLSLFLKKFGLML
jgi:hypothetical protein